jgi:hypothetical protein
MAGIAVLCLSLLSTSNASAQSKFTKILLTNSTGSTTLSQTSEGLTINNDLVLTNPAIPGSEIILEMPTTATPLTFTFPTTQGTLLTNVPNQSNGDDLISAINAGSLKIDAGRLNISASNLSANQPLQIAANTLSLNYTNTLKLTGNQLTIDLANSNTWTGVQLLPESAAQGNNLIDAINAAGQKIDLARVNINASTNFTAGTITATLSGNATTATTATTANAVANTNAAGASLIAALTTNGGTLTNNTSGNAATATTATTAGNVTGTVAVANGGTGVQSVTQHSLLLGNGTSALTELAPGTSGYVLTSNGPNSAPTWQQVSGGGGVSLSANNTWTGRQTLPQTANQGNDLIASINAGTSQISGTRIGYSHTTHTISTNGDDLTITTAMINANSIHGINNTTSNGGGQNEDITIEDGSFPGQILVIYSITANTTRVLDIDGQVELRDDSNFTLNQLHETITLMYTGAEWISIGAN